MAIQRESMFLCHTIACYSPCIIYGGINPYGSKIRDKDYVQNIETYQCHCSISHQTHRLEGEITRRIYLYLRYEVATSIYCKNQLHGTLIVGQSKSPLVTIMCMPKNHVRATNPCYKYLTENHTTRENMPCVYCRILPFSDSIMLPKGMALSLECVISRIYLPIRYTILFSPSLPSTC